MIDDAVLRLLTAAATLESRYGLRACVIGGIARNLWAEPRATLDVDVIVDTPDAATVLPFASAMGLVAVQAEVTLMARSEMTRLRLPEELSGETRLDVIANSHEYYTRVLDRSIVVEAFGVRIRVAVAEDIVVLKSLAARPQDLIDIAAIIEAQGAKLDRELVRRECAALEIDVPHVLRHVIPI